MRRYIDTEKIHITADTMADEMGEIYVSLTDVRKSIDQTPTADVVEVRHGRWLRYGQDYTQCPLCGAVNTNLNINNFCPNCGARMDYFRKTVFLTREEAEKSLAERSENER
jgi:rubrerythrin